MEILILILIILIILIIYNIKIIHGINSEKLITSIIKEATLVRFSYENSNNDNVIIVKNKIMFDKIARNGEVGLADSYIDGDWDTSNLENILSLLIQNKNILIKKIYRNSLSFVLLRITSLVKSIFPNNTIDSSKTNISHHYDIGNDLYKKMLGKYMMYTCAYFYKNNITLDDAQLAKMELIAKKLNLSKGMTVLDIGCGFGSMAYYLASKYDINIVGCTLSSEQKKYADEHFSHKNVTILLKDYRHMDGKFDRVYSIGMFEHVGRKNYKTYFNKCYELLNDNGIMLLHTIGTKSSDIWDNNCFINKYIFPEGELPRISDMTDTFITDKWNTEDFQNFGLSYAKTLKSWRKNIGDWHDLDNYDNKFRRMWDYYLYGCSAAFQNRDIYLWQFVYTKNNTNMDDDLHHIRN